MCCPKRAEAIVISLSALLHRRHYMILLVGHPAGVRTKSD
jgi:hypothetical protein